MKYTRHSTRREINDNDEDDDATISKIIFSHSYKSTDYVNEHENRLKFKVCQIEIIKKEKEINRKREMRDDNITNKEKEITCDTCKDVPRAHTHTRTRSGNADSSDTHTQSINRLFLYIMVEL